MNMSKNYRKLYADVFKSFLQKFLFKNKIKNFIFLFFKIVIQSKKNYLTKNDPLLSKKLLKVMTISTNKIEQKLKLLLTN